METLLDSDIDQRIARVNDRNRSIDRAVEDVIRFVSGAEAEFANRRAHKRVPFTELFPVMPVDEQSQQVADTIYAVGKNISMRGIGFFHHVAIPSRFVVIGLHQSKATMTHFLVRLSWCRFLRPDWYDSGGQIIQTVDWSDPIQSPS